MLELKVFVQESVHALDDDALRILSDTLRVDARGCDDRRDLERVLTGLLCLDKDTALGTFLSWLRTRENQAHASGLLARKSAFLNTFVPVISPRKAPPTNQEPAAKDHHLNDEIQARLDELALLEQDFKDAERTVHSGTPSFDKLKAFLVNLTKLRAKEQDVRRYFIQQSESLTKQHAEMKDETLHTRAQLDFFVDGFTNLRHRHDALVEASTHMKAENEVAQDVFVSIAAHESHFGAVLHRTMCHMLDEKRLLTQELEDARREISTLTTKQQQLEQLVSRLKHERGNALKDASAYKLQLRKCKQKMEDLTNDGPDVAYFRQQAMQLRGALTTLLSMFRESIARDTKSPKQTLSKEIVRTVQRVLLAPPQVTTATSNRKSLRVSGAAAIDERIQDPVARVVEKKRVAANDVDEVVRGVVLLGGEDGEAAACATALCTKLRYVPVDVKSVLEQLRDDATRASERLTAASSIEGALPVLSVSVPPPPATVENYVIPLQAALKTLQKDRGAKGVVLYNYELTARDANLLIGSGIPIDSIIDLQVPPPPVPPTPVLPTPSAQGKTAAASKGSASPSRGTARPASKAAPSPSSPSRPSSRQATADPKKPPSTASSTGSRPTTNAASPAKPIKKIDRRAMFASLLRVFAQLPPVAFVEDRVAMILDELTRQKHERETPHVVWDDVTSELNESLLMYAEDVHMMIWVEQDNRKPKKPQDAVKATPPTSSSSTAKPGSTSPTSKKAPAKAPAKGKAASPTRSPSKPAAAKAKTASPTKPKAASQSKPKTSSPAKPAASASPKKPVTAASPAKRKA